MLVLHCSTTRYVVLTDDVEDTDISKHVNTSRQISFPYLYPLHIMTRPVCCVPVLGKSRTNILLDFEFSLK